MSDLNKFESLGQITEGCGNGKHMFDESEGHIGIEQDGNNTKIKLKCLVCGKQIDISAPFGLNEYLKQGHQPIQPQVRISSGSASGSSGHGAPSEQSDILKRILG